MPGPRVQGLGRPPSERPPARKNGGRLLRTVVGRSVRDDPSQMLAAQRRQ
jgi:hypothetical protein